MHWIVAVKTCSPGILQITTNIRENSGINSIKWEDIFEIEDSQNYFWSKINILLGKI